MLVFGAGPLGSLLAARLTQGDLDVTLLARGQRLEEIEQHGLWLKHWESGQEEKVQIRTVSRLEPEDCYDVIIVVMRKNSALKVLPILAQNSSKHVLFLMNNAAGPGELVKALGAERVMLGFMSAAGFREGEKVVYMNGEPGRPGMIYMGEMDGRQTDRLKEIAAMLERGKHIQVKLEANMDAWLKYHVAMLFPAFAPTLYLCGNDRERFARTRDALVLAWRGVKEAVRVLRKLKYPVEPPIIKTFLLIPEPVMVWLLSRLSRNPRIEVAAIRHAKVIRDEIQQLNAEFMLLVKASGLFTPNILFLMAQYDAQAHPLPDGSRSLKMDWSGVIIPILVLAVTVLALMLIF